MWGSVRNEAVLPRMDCVVLSQTLAGMEIQPALICNERGKETACQTDEKSSSAREGLRSKENESLLRPKQSSAVCFKWRPWGIDIRQWRDVKVWVPLSFSVIILHSRALWWPDNKALLPLSLSPCRSLQACLNACLEWLILPAAIHFTAARFTGGLGAARVRWPTWPVPIVTPDTDFRALCCLCPQICKLLSLSKFYLFIQNIQSFFQRNDKDT